MQSMISRWFLDSSERKKIFEVLSINVNKTVGKGINSTSLNDQRKKVPYIRLVSDYHKTAACQTIV